MTVDKELKMVGDSFSREDVLEMALLMEVTPQEREANRRLLKATSGLGARLRTQNEQAARKADRARALVFVAPFVILMWFLALSVPS